MLSILVVLILAIVGTPFWQITTAFDVNELYDRDFTPGELVIVEPQNTTYIDIVSLYIAVTRAPEFGPNDIYYKSPVWGGDYRYSIDGQDNVTIPIGTPPNITLTDLGAGSHYIVAYTCFYVAWGQLAGPYYFSSEPVYFSVITIQEPQNKTYHTKDVPLIFTMDRPVPRLTYSLDNEAKITITENTTLSSLPYGSHQIIIYADETATSRTIYFNKQVSPTLILSISSATAITIGSIVAIYKKRTALT